MKFRIRIQTEQHNDDIMNTCNILIEVHKYINTSLYRVYPYIQNTHIHTFITSVVSRIHIIHTQSH